MINRGRVFLKPFIFRPLCPCTTTKGETPLYDYEYFSKKIHQANELQEVINIYKKYSAGMQDNAQNYLATTMRILSRLTKQKEKRDVESIQTFFGLSRPQLNSLKVQSLERQNLNYFIIFFHTLSKNESMLNIVRDNLKLVESCLEELVRRMKKMKGDQKVNYVSTLFYSLKISHLLCPHLQPSIIDSIIELLYAESDHLIADNYSFSNFLYILREIYTPGNPHHEQLIHTVFFFLSLQNYLSTYEEYSLVNILITILTIENKLTPQIPIATSKLLKQIKTAIENRLVQDMKKLNQRTHNFMVQNLLQLKIDHKLLKQYFRIIQQAIDHQGQAKVNPKVIVFAVSLLSRQEMVRYLSKEWEVRFLRMMELYFSPSQQFKTVSAFTILTILQKQILSPQNSLKLYEFYFEHWKQYNKQIVTEYDYMKRIIQRVQARYETKQQ